MKTVTILSLLVLIAFSFSFVSCEKVERAKSVDKNLPNIVFILADDMGYGDLNCYNADPYGIQEHLT